MNNGRFFLFCILVLSNSFGNTKGEPQFSEEYFPRESPRSLEVSDNLILVEYSRNFNGNLKGFVSKNTEIIISHAYLDDDKTDYIDNITTLEIKPGTKLRLGFSSPPTTLAYFFFNMTKIKSIDLSSFDSTQVTTMRSLFDGCTSLESITFGANFNTKKVTIMNSLFYDCSALTSIDLSQFNTESVTDMDLMFFNCNILTEINLTNFKTTKLVTAIGIFESCSSLVSIDLSSFNTEKMVYMSFMFSECSELTSINFGSNFNTKNVRYMDNMFMECEKLTILDLSHFRTPSLISMVEMFEECSSLVGLDISNFDLKQKNGRKVDISDMFSGVTNLKYLNLLDIELGEIDFSKSDLNDIANLIVCKNEETTAFSDTTSKIFRCCETPFNSSLCNYIIVKYTNFSEKLNGFVSVNRNIIISHLYLDDNETDYIDKIETLKIKSGTKLRIQFNHPLTILSYFFYYMRRIKSIDFSHFNSTELTDMGYLFYFCIALEAITFGDAFDTKKVTKMNDLFSGCIFTSIDLSTFNTESVTNMNSMFVRCNRLNTVNLSNFNTTSLETAIDMFRLCRALVSIDLSSFNTKNAKLIGGMFYNCNKLTSINFGNNFNTENITNMDYMFSGCVKLTSLDLSQFRTTSSVSMVEMFADCSSLVALDISNFRMSLYGVDYTDMFRGVTNLKYLNLQNATLNFYDFSKTYLNNVTNLTVCKKEGTTPFSNTTSKAFRCCETPFNSSLCNYIIVEYKNNFTDKLIGFNTRNSEINKAYIYYYDDFDYIVNISKMEIKPGSKLKIEFSTLPTSLNEFFFNMTKIKAIDFSHFYSNTVKGMKSLFNGCTELETVIFGENFNTKNVTNMNSLFSGCSHLASIDLSKLNTELVTDMNLMFYQCSELTEINLTTFNTINVKTIEGMFQSCSALVSLDLSNFNVTYVTSMNRMFSGCSELTSINFGSNFDVRGAYTMDSMFKDCVKLTSLDISQFKTLNCYSYVEMFAGCSSLVVLDISNFDFDKGRRRVDYSNIFRGVTNLQYLNLLNIVLAEYNEIDFSNTALNSLGNLTICIKDANKLFSNRTSKSFRCCETPFNKSKCGYNYIVVEYSKNFNDNLIGFISKNPEINISHIYLDDEVNYVSNIRTMVIKPGSKLKIEFSAPVTTLAYFFYNMTKIKSIDFSHFDSSEVTDINSLFSRCVELETITFGDDFNTKKVTNMSNLFYGCSNLTSIDLSKFNTEFVTNMSYLFSGCNSLESINFNGIDTSSVVDMSNMFYNCRSLKISELLNFNTKKVTNMSYMFYGCKSLEVLNLTNFNTSDLLNMKAMFRNSDSLVTLDISTFNTRKVTTMAYLFSGCGKLKNLYYISVLDSPSVIDRIGMYDGCDSLFSPDNPDFRGSYNDSSLPNGIVLLGFNSYKLISNNNKITFNIYFYSYEYFEFPQLLYLSAYIIYNSQLRLLQNENNVECIKGEETLNYIEKYECGVNIENLDIKNIGLNDSIDFGTENNLIISPLASEHINNLQNLENIDLYDDLFDNADIFILYNSKLEQNGKLLNVTGEMKDDPQLPIGKNITLLVKSEEEQTKHEINCNVSDNDTSKYTLICNIINNTITYDLNNSMSIMDNDIIMIYFEDGNSTTNKPVTDKSNTYKLNRKYYSKSNSGISSGAIVAIILCPILALALVSAIIFYSKKNNNKRPTMENQSSLVRIDINKNI